MDQPTARLIPPVSEAAKAAGVTDVTVRNWIKAERLQSHPAPDGKQRGVLVDLADVLAIAPSPDRLRPMAACEFAS